MSNTNNWQSYSATKQSNDGFGRNTNTNSTAKTGWQQIKHEKSRNSSDLYSPSKDKENSESPNVSPRKGTLPVSQLVKQVRIYRCLI